MTEAEALVIDLTLALLGKYPREDIRELLGHSYAWLQRQRGHAPAPPPRPRPKLTLIQGGKQ